VSGGSAEGGGAEGKAGTVRKRIEKGTSANSAATNSERASRRSVTRRLVYIPWTKKFGRVGRGGQPYAGGGEAGCRFTDSAGDLGLRDLDPQTGAENR